MTGPLSLLVCDRLRLRHRARRSFHLYTHLIRQTSALCQQINYEGEYFNTFRLLVRIHPSTVSGIVCKSRTIPW
jgi:hypothetical protein